MAQVKRKDNSGLTLANMYYDMRETKSQLLNQWNSVDSRIDRLHDERTEEIRSMREDLKDLKDTQQRTKIELVNLKTGVTVLLIVVIAAMAYFLAYWLFGEVVHKFVFTLTILSGFALLMQFWFRARWDA